MRPTTTVTVFCRFADTTTPTFVLRRKRRQPVPALSPAGLCATVAAVRLRTLVVVLRAAAVAVTAFVATGASATAAFAAVVFFAAVAFAAVVFFAAVAFVAVVFFVVFSAIGLLAPLRLHREQARHLAPRDRQRAIVLQLARRQLEAKVEELFLRALELVRELVIRQPPHVLQLHLSHLPAR